MKDYVKPCIRENNPDHVIIHVGTNELDSERQADMIAKPIIRVAKGIRTISTMPYNQYIKDSPKERQL